MALLVDAAAERILRTTGLPSYDADYSATLWYYAVGLPGSNTTDTLFSINDNTNDEDTYALRNTAGTTTLRIVTITGGSSTNTLGATVIGASTWYHIGIVRAGNGDRKLYLNGALEITHATSVSGRTAPTRMELGGLRSANADGATGRFAGVKVWTRALTQAEIQAEIQTLRPQGFDSLHLWSPMFPGSGENVRDYSGNGRDWTLGSSPTDADPPPVGYGAPVWFILWPVAGSVTVDLSGTTADATTSALAPGVVLGSLTLDLAAQVALATSSAIAPSVVIAGGGTTVDLSGLPASASATAVSPSVVHGSLSISPAVASAATSAIAPSVMLGSVTVGPAEAMATAAAVAPSVILGALTIDLAASPAIATATAIAPTVDAGTGISLDLSGSPAVATATAIAPSVVLGSVSVDLSGTPASATASALAPAVVLSSVSVDLAAVPATATASAVAPIVVTAAAVTLPVRSTSVLATRPASLSTVVVVARASSAVVAPESHAAVAETITSTSSRVGPSSTATLV